MFQEVQLEDDKLRIAKDWPETEELYLYQGWATSHGIGKKVFERQRRIPVKNDGTKPLVRYAKATYIALRLV